jgi:hypothetical protein
MGRGGRAPQEGAWAQASRRAGGRAGGRCHAPARAVWIEVRARAGLAARRHAPVNRRLQA